MRRFFFVTLLLLGVSSFAFATSMIPKEVRIDETSNGKTMNIFLGQTLSISLGENPTTGYRWTVEDFKPSLLEQLETIFKAGGSAVGAGGTRIFGFLAKKVGETQLKLEYQRPWAETAKPEKSFSISIKIVKAGSKPDVQLSLSPRAGPMMILGKSLNALSQELGKLNADELKQTSVVEFRGMGENKEYVGLIVITDPKRLPRCPNEKLPMSNQALLAMVKNLVTHYGKKSASKEPAFLLGGFCQPGFVQVTLVGTGLGLYFNIETGEPMGKLTGKL